MKKIIILLTCILATSLFSMAQQDFIEVQNRIGAHYTIKAVYFDGSSYVENNISLDTGSPSSPYCSSIPYVHPNHPNHYLDHFKVFTTDCTPVLTAEFTYNQSDQIDITDCGRCGQGFTGEAKYTASSYYLGLRCYQ